MAKSADAFRTISEVAEWLDTPAHVLRFWESRFTQVKPVKRAGGRRYFRPADMELLGGIKKLLHEDGMTIKGVQKKLKTEGVKAVAALSQAVIPPSDAVINAEDEATPVMPPITPKPEISETPVPVETSLPAEAPKPEPITPVASSPVEPAISDPVTNIETNVEAEAPTLSTTTAPAVAAPTLPVPEAPAPADPTPIAPPLRDPATELNASVEVEAPTFSAPDTPVPPAAPLEPEDEADTWLDPQDLPSASEIEATLSPAKPVTDTAEDAPIADDVSLDSDANPAADIPDVTPPQAPALRPDVITLPDDLADDAELEIPSNIADQLRMGTLKGNVADLRAENDRLTALHARLQASITPNALG